jgi:hypothetical protein
MKVGREREHNSRKQLKEEELCGNIQRLTVSSEEDHLITYGCEPEPETEWEEVV